MKSLFILLTLLFAAPAAPAASPADVSAIISSQDKKETKTVTFKTTMHCENCVKKVTENISFMRGVKDLKVSLDENVVTITYDPSRTNEDLLAAAIRKLGYEAEKVEPDKA
jgi:Copper chaperone